MMDSKPQIRSIKAPYCKGDGILDGEPIACLRRTTDPTGYCYLHRNQAAPILCPECRNGKCVNCILETLNDADEWVPCQCPEHREKP